MQVVKVNADSQIDFPARVKEWLKMQEELVLYFESDTLILKTIHSPKLSGIAGRKNGEEIAAERISDQVHAYRRSRKKG